MNFRSVVVILLLVVASNFVEEAHADECQDFLHKFLMNQMKYIVPCINKLGLSKPAEKKGKVYCIMRCVMQDAKMLGADGNVDIDLVNTHLDGVPPNLKEKANAIFTECGHHAASLDPAEPTCTSYGPLLTCITDIAAKMC